MAKILIADDNTNIQKMVALAFEERGIDVVSVGNGETAVRKLPDVNPDLVLADVFMPVRNGYEVCEFVKKDGRYAHVPVILLVGAFDPLDEKEARRVGADGVLKKPFVPPDPLIAMVMSALERNPRVAAELAKAKEVIPEPEPLPPALENPAQKAPTPLPEFPEPSAEEAAQIYGFGKGVRTLDETDEESKNSSPKKPASEEANEEDIDASTTQHDWRRRGMDLDIPEDIAAKPAFSTDQDFSSVSFPSEKDVPPRHVRVSDPEEETLRSAKRHIELPLEPEESPVKETKPEHKQEVKAEAPVAPPEPPPVVAPAPVIPEPPAPVAAAPEHSRPSRGFFASLFGARRVEEAPAAPEPPQSHLQSAPSISAPAAVEEPSPLPVASAAPLVSAPEPVSAPAPEAKFESKHETHPDPEPESAAASHWMDLMSPTPSPASGSWLDALSPKVGMVASTAADSSAASTVSKPEISEPAPVANAEPATSAPLSEPGPPAAQVPANLHYEGAPLSSEPELSAVVEAKTEASQPRVFGGDASRSGFSYHFAGGEERSSVVESSPSYEVAAADPAIDSPLAEPEAPSVAAPSPASDSSFFAPEPERAVAPEAPVEPLAPPHEFAAETTVAETVSQIFRTPSSESSERIPTAPPPNREAIAGIPFLVPPKEITEPVDVTPRAAESAPPVDVEAVVQRVVEKLGPQLQELLSQGLLKPLVENILQQELAKKEK